MDQVFLDATTRVAVIGAGSMGAGIAQLAAQSGHEVRLFDMQPGAAQRALERIAQDLDAAVERGRMAPAARDAARARLVAVQGLEELAGCGLAVEAIVEKLEPKQQLFRQLEPLLGERAVLATNTSSISVTAVAQGLKHPQRLIGWHFFNPATRMKLVEVIRGVETDPALVPALHALSEAWGKTSVDAPNAPGFIVNRVARPYYAEGLRLMAERIAPAAAIDRLMREAGGFAMGPFELMDLIGVEVNLSVTESVFQATAFDPRFAPSLIQQELVRSGRFGRKSGHGFHRYGADAPPPQVQTVAPAPAAAPVRCAADMGLLAPLAERLRRAGVAVEPDAELPAESFAVAGVRVMLTDGRTATERAATEGQGPVLLLDLARDVASTALLGAAASVGAEACLAELAAVLQPAGIGLLALDDVAGLALMRTVCCLANEAADVITWSGATARDIDVAMRLGTAYPVGPLAWADALGAARVATVLRHLQAHYGDLRYRRSPLLTRLQHAGGSFHS